MKINSKILVSITSVVLASLLVACSNPDAIKNVAKQEGAVTLLAFSEEGQPIVINSKTGKPVPTCDELDRMDAKKIQSDGLTPCKTRIKESANGELILVDRNTGEPRKLIRKIETTTWHFEGSHCETSFVAGMQWEICWPW